MKILSDKGEVWKKSKIMFTEESSLGSDLHGHEFVELVYFCETKGYHFVNNKYVPIHEGMMFIVPPETPHCYVESLQDPRLAGINVMNLIFVRSVFCDSSKSDRTFLDCLYDYYLSELYEKSDFSEDEPVYVRDIE